MATKAAILYAYSDGGIYAATDYQQPLSESFQAEGDTWSDDENTLSDHEYDSVNVENDDYQPGDDDHLVYGNDHYGVRNEQVGGGEGGGGAGKTEPLVIDRRAHKIIKMGDIFAGRLKTEQLPPSALTPQRRGTDANMKRGREQPEEGDEEHPRKDARLQIPTFLVSGLAASMGCELPLEKIESCFNGFIAETLQLPIEGLYGANVSTNYADALQNETIDIDTYREFVERLNALANDFGVDAMDAQFSEEHFSHKYHSVKEKHKHKHKHGHDHHHHDHDHGDKKKHNSFTKKLHKFLGNDYGAFAEGGDGDDDEDRKFTPAESEFVKERLATLNASQPSSKYSSPSSLDQATLNCPQCHKGGGDHDKKDDNDKYRYPIYTSLSFACSGNRDKDDDNNYGFAYTNEPEDMKNFQFKEVYVMSFSQFPAFLQQFCDPAFFDRNIFQKAYDWVRGKKKKSKSKSKKQKKGSDDDEGSGAEEGEAQNKGGKYGNVYYEGSEGEEEEGTLDDFINVATIYGFPITNYEGIKDWFRQFGKKVKRAFSKSPKSQDFLALRPYIPGTTLVSNNALKSFLDLVYKRTENDDSLSFENDAATFSAGPQESVRFEIDRIGKKDKELLNIKAEPFIRLRPLASGDLKALDQVTIRQFTNLDTTKSPLKKEDLFETSLDRASTYADLAASGYAFAIRLNHEKPIVMRSTMGLNMSKKKLEESSEALSPVWFYEGGLNKETSNGRPGAVLVFQRPNAPSLQEAMQVKLKAVFLLTPMNKEDAETLSMLARNLNELSSDPIQTAAALKTYITEQNSARATTDALSLSHALAVIGSTIKTLAPNPDSFKTNIKYSTEIPNTRVAESHYQTLCQTMNTLAHESRIVDSVEGRKALGKMFAQTLSNVGTNDSDAMAATLACLLHGTTLSCSQTPLDGEQRMTEFLNSKAPYDFEQLM